MSKLRTHLLISDRHTHMHIWHTNKVKFNEFHFKCFCCAFCVLFVYLGCFARSFALFMPQSDLKKSISRTMNFQLKITFDSNEWNKCVYCQFNWIAEFKRQIYRLFAATHFIMCYTIHPSIMEALKWSLCSIYCVFTQSIFDLNQRRKMNHHHNNNNSRIVCECGVLCLFTQL